MLVIFGLVIEKGHQIGLLCPWFNLIPLPVFFRFTAPFKSQLFLTKFVFKDQDIQMFGPKGEYE